MNFRKHLTLPDVTWNVDVDGNDTTNGTMTPTPLSVRTKRGFGFGRNGDGQGKGSNWHGTFRKHRKIRLRKTNTANSLLGLNVLLRAQPKEYSTRNGIVTAMNNYYGFKVGSWRSVQSARAS